MSEWLTDCDLALVKIQDKTEQDWKWLTWHLRRNLLRDPRDKSQFEFCRRATQRDIHLEKKKMTKNVQENFKNGQKEQAKLTKKVQNWQKQKG